MPPLRRSFTALTVLGAALLCGVLAAAPALANLTGAGLTITAKTDNGDVATFEVPLPDPLPPNWTWETYQKIELRSPTTGDLLGVINPGGEETYIGYQDDPVITLAFVAQAGGATTTFTICSALLSFAAIPNPEGRASTGMSVTDSDGDGVTLTGIGDPSGAQGAYLAQYNGFACTLLGTTFAELIPSLAAGAFSSNTASAAVPPIGFQPIGVAVSDMSVMVSFKLTANDQASGTSVYVIRQQVVPVVPTTWGRVKSLYR